jgi:Tol biopolymer transport system component
MADTSLSRRSHNLVNSDERRLRVFVYDRTLADRARELTSTGAEIAGASQTPVVSSDGRYVAFVSGAATVVSGDGNGVFDVFVRDRQLGTTKRVSVNSSSVQGNGASFRPAIASDGSHLALISAATNLVAVDQRLDRVFCEHA